MFSHKYKLVKIMSTHSPYLKEVINENPAIVSSQNVNEKSPN